MLDWIVNKDIHAPFMYIYILSSYVLSGKPDGPAREIVLRSREGPARTGRL